MKFEDNVELDISMLAEKLLDTLLPSDSGGYSKRNREVIQAAEGLNVFTDCREITEDELKIAMFSMGRKKVPGFYDIPVEILC